MRRYRLYLLTVSSLFTSLWTTRFSKYCCCPLHFSEFSVMRRFRRWCFFSSESWTEGWRNCNHILCFHNFHSFFFNLEEMKLFSRSVQSYSFLELFHFSITLKKASFIFTFHNLRLRFTLMNWNSLISNRDAHRKAYSS